ncbi:unnamed protein product [Pleuronectes platessa]|uniref:Uncharacterized protein n=1 Tax=Pleuronectes platessa TaxID=8262 RepID=A0A9N7U7Z9_PLEPL|nr:unnamed protein product [Pleuronectes platessa]
MSLSLSLAASQEMLTAATPSPLADHDQEWTNILVAVPASAGPEIAELMCPLLHLLVDIVVFIEGCVTVEDIYFLSKLIQTSMDNERATPSAVQTRNPSLDLVTSNLTSLNLKDPFEKSPEPPGHLHAHLRDGGVQPGGVPAEARSLHTAARPPGHERESTELLIRTLPFQRIQLARRIRGHRP